MVFEIGPLIGHTADLFAARLVRYLISVMEDEVGETGQLSEISILAGGYEMARAIEVRDKKISRRHIYIVARNAQDAKTIEKVLLGYTSDPGYERLKDAIRTIDSDFTTFCWEADSSLDAFTQDIADMLAASTLILPGEVSRKCFRGTTSWIEV